MRKGLALAAVMTLAASPGFTVAAKDQSKPPGLPMPGPADWDLKYVPGSPYCTLALPNSGGRPAPVFFMSNGDDPVLLVFTILEPGQVHEFTIGDQEFNAAFSQSELSPRAQWAQLDAGAMSALRDGKAIDVSALTGEPTIVAVNDARLSLLQGCGNSASRTYYATMSRRVQQEREAKEAQRQAQLEEQRRLAKAQADLAQAQAQAQAQTQLAAAQRQATFAALAQFGAALLEASKPPPPPPRISFSCTTYGDRTECRN